MSHTSDHIAYLFNGCSSYRLRDAAIDVFKCIQSVTGKMFRTVGGQATSSHEL